MSSELTTGVGRELNNPLNNAALFVGNAIDLIELGGLDRARILRELRKAMQQIRTATRSFRISARLDQLPRPSAKRSPYAG
jgi:hypothetical protein